MKNYFVREIFSKRNLIYELVLRDLKIHYARPALGFFWTFLTPFSTVAVLSLVFSLILKVKIREAPFFLYLMSAVFSWRFFQDTLLSSTTCLLDNKNLVREANFPHYFLPISILLTNLVNFLPSLALTLIIASFTLKGISLFVFLLPAILLIHISITLGLSIILAVLYVRFRDLKYLLEPVLLLALYLTPVFYSLSLVKEIFPHLLFKVYIYNPFVGILNLYRIAIFKDFFSLIYNDAGLLSLMMPVIFALLFLWFGFYFYQKNKDKINDYLSY